MYLYRRVYRIPVRRCVSHPPAAAFQARLLDNQEGANTERHVNGKHSARCFQHRRFWRRLYSNCRDIEHGKSAQGVWHTPSDTVDTGDAGTVILPKNYCSTRSQDTTRAQSRRPPAESGETGTIRHDEETARREVDLIASKLENGSKPGLKTNF